MGDVVEHHGGVVPRLFPVAFRRCASRRRLGSRAASLDAALGAQPVNGDKIMETLLNEIPVMFVESPNGPAGSGEAFNQLESSLETLNGRKF